MKRAIITLAFPLVFSANFILFADSFSNNTSDSSPEIKMSESASNSSMNVAFKHLDLGISLGSGGVGLELATPISGSLKLRAGVEVMPQFSVPMSFNLRAYSTTGGISTKFEHMQELMYELTEIETDENVRMKGRPDMINFKLLLDLAPWHNKAWHVTVGFLYGSHRIAYAENYTEEATSLLGVKMFNNMYEYFTSEGYIDEPFPVLGYIDPDVGDTAKDKFTKYGRIGVHVGDFKDTGEPYLMEPDEYGMVKVRAYVNRFKPYFGFGHNSALTKDKRLNLAFDAGLIYWGTPKVLTHEGVDLVKDLENIPGKVGRYTNIFRNLKFYPEISLRLSYTLF